MSRGKCRDEAVSRGQVTAEGAENAEKRGDLKNENNMFSK